MSYQCGATLCVRLMMSCQHLRLSPRSPVWIRFHLRETLPEEDEPPQELAGKWGGEMVATSSKNDVSDVSDICQILPFSTELWFELSRSQSKEISLYRTYSCWLRGQARSSSLCSLHLFDKPCPLQGADLVHKASSTAGRFFTARQLFFESLTLSFASC